MLKHVRVCATAAAVATALVLTGCSSDDGGSGKRKTDDSASTSGGQGGTGGSEPSESADPAAEPGSLDGLWVAVSGGKSVALSVQQGGKVAVLAEMGVGEKTGITCVGKAGEERGTQMINLKCQGGGEREMGRVESVDATSMKVSWEGVGTDEFKKQEKGDLPEGLPTGLSQG